MNNMSANHILYIARKIIDQFRDMMPQNILSTEHPGWKKAQLVVLSGLNFIDLAVVFKLRMKVLRQGVIVNFQKNFMHRMSNVPSNFNNCRSLNGGSVWSLCLLLVIILIARFCNFDSLLHSKPYNVIPNCKCERMRESHSNFMAEIGRYF